MVLVVEMVTATPVQILYRTEYPSAQITLEKVCIQLFPLQLWVN